MLYICICVVYKFTYMWGFVVGFVGKSKRDILRRIKNKSEKARRNDIVREESGPACSSRADSSLAVLSIQMVKQVHYSTVW